MDKENGSDTGSQLGNMQYWHHGSHRCGQDRLRSGCSFILEFLHKMGEVHDGSTSQTGWSRSVSVGSRHIFYSNLFVER